jgi:hypothetical protein
MAVKKSKKSKSKKSKSEKVKRNKSEKISVTKLVVKKEKVRQNLNSHEWYKAEFKNAEIKPGKFGPYCRFQFEIKNGLLEDDETSAKGTLTSAMCDAEVTLGSKMYDFVAGIIGNDPELDEGIDITPYYGDTYEVFIVTEKKKGADRAHSNVTKIRVPKKKKSKKKKKK